MKTIGMVASKPHISGSLRSAIRLRIMKTAQKIFFCTSALPFPDNRQHARAANSIVL